MILSQPDLRKAVERCQIIFDPPLEEKQWGEASIDLRLGFSFTRLKDLPGMKISVAEGLNTIGSGGFWETGPLTIELTPLIDRPCQLTFFQLSKPLPKKLIYGARSTDIYQDQKHPLKHPRRQAEGKPLQKR
jgi:deoxycytidine triphosphate deaminase